ncbi:hypothetical protein DL96DRAFT_415365 [Flagelloscypha sp. PMI_526]|nr:hypothetical protein DL96DRAFT_415365 [Flagelloscypha sp. PMI_526]
MPLIMPSMSSVLSGDIFLIEPSYSPRYGPHLDSDVWLAIFCLLEVHDILRLRQVSRLFFELSRQTSLLLALYNRQEPGWSLTRPPCFDSMERFLKFRANWTSPFPCPIEPPRELRSLCHYNEVAALRIVELRDGSSWLVIINEPQIYGEPWRNLRGYDHDSNFVFIQAIPSTAIKLPDYPEKANDGIRWEFGKWCAVVALPSGTKAESWVFDEDEHSPYVLSLICLDGFIHTYSLSSTEGWICALKTPLAPNIQFDEIGFIASSGGIAVAMINTADLQPSIALIDLQDEKGKITSLLNPHGIQRHELLGHCVARFSHTHVVVFYRLREGYCRGVLVYPLQNMAKQDTIWPVARSELPQGTNNFIFSHTTTSDLTFTILLTHAHAKYAECPWLQPGEPELIHRDPGDSYFSPTHTTFTFSFDPLSEIAAFFEKSDIPDLYLYHTHSCIPHLSRSARAVLHWGEGGEIKCEHLGLEGERKSSVLLRSSRHSKRGLGRGHIVVDVDDRKGLVAWWWGGSPWNMVTLVKYGNCEGL